MSYLTIPERWQHSVMHHICIIDDTRYTMESGTPKRVDCEYCGMIWYWQPPNEDINLAGRYMCAPEVKHWRRAMDGIASTNEAIAFIRKMLV